MIDATEMILCEKLQPWSQGEISWAGVKGDQCEHCRDEPSEVASVTSEGKSDIQAIAQPLLWDISYSLETYI